MTIVILNGTVGDIESEYEIGHLIKELRKAGIDAVKFSPDVKYDKQITVYRDSVNIHGGRKLLVNDVPLYNPHVKHPDLSHVVNRVIDILIKESGDGV